MSHRVILLGPQRHVPRVRPALAAILGGRGHGPVALVTAGWEEREGEDGEFREHLQAEVVNLEVWARVERIFAADPDLLEAMRQRHDTLRQAQELYRLRLDGLVAAAFALLRREGDAQLLDPERAAAIAMLQQLDREHMARVAAVHEEFTARVRPAERAAVQHERREIEKLLHGASCLCIAGGHVGVLLHRLRLFALLDLWGRRPLIAWSAGAMVLCERIVLFHQDHTAQSLAGGNGLVDTEVLEAGLGVVHGVVPLPHARRRLDLRDPLRMQLMARRFEPASCVLLDDGDRIDWDGQRWSAPGPTRRLLGDGRSAEVGR